MKLSESLKEIGLTVTEVAEALNISKFSLYSTNKKGTVKRAKAFEIIAEDCINSPNRVKSILSWMQWVKRGKALTYINPNEADLLLNFLNILEHENTQVLSKADA